MKVCLACDYRFQAADWQCPRCGWFPELLHGYPAFAANLTARNDAYDATRFAQLAQVEAGSFWFRSRNRLLIWALQRYFPGARNFLELGCGTGFVLSGIHRAFPRLIVSGGDITVEGLRYANSRLPAVSLFQMDARRIPFEAEFDLIGAFDVLEHVAEDSVVLSQMSRALKSDGGIMLTVPQHRFLWSYKDIYSCHKRRYSRKELVEKVERAGFTIIRTTSFVSFLLPLMLLSRLRQRKPKQNYDPTKELRVVGILNLLLEKVLDLERILIKHGFSLPVGGSLLVIAKRTQE